MLKKITGFRSVLGFILGLSLLCPGAFAQSNDRRGDQRGNQRVESRIEAQRDDRADRRVNNREHDHGDRHYYRDGRWYKRGWFGWEFAVSALAIGTLVESLPPNHTTIVVGNSPYYYDNSRYYRQLSDGSYIVVSAPR